MLIFVASSETLSDLSTKADIKSDVVSILSSKSDTGIANCSSIIDSSCANVLGFITDKNVTHPFLEKPNTTSHIPDGHANLPWSDVADG